MRDILGHRSWRIRAVFTSLLLFESVKISGLLRSENSPPWRRRGGRAINKNIPKAPCLARTGWFVQATDEFSDQHHLSAPLLDAARYRACSSLKAGFAAFFLMPQPALLS